MSNLTRRNFFGVGAVVAGLGITACKKSAILIQLTLLVLQKNL